MLRTIKTTLVLLTLVSFMEIYCSCAVVTKPVSTSGSASAEDTGSGSDAVNQMTFFFKNIVNALFLNANKDENRNSRVRTGENAYDGWNNDLFNFNPIADPFRYRYYVQHSHRKLTPIDLTQAFVFDDEDEILAAAKNPSVIPPDMTSEYLEEMSSFQKPEFFKSTAEKDAPSTDLIETPYSDESNEHIGNNNKVKEKVSDSKISGFFGLPIPISAKLESLSEIYAIEEPKASVKKRSAKSESSLIFPDDPEYDISLRPERTTDADDEAEIECKEHETFFNSKCETLFNQNSCPIGEHLVEDVETGIGKCFATNCRYPESVSLAGTGECVMLRHHTCPEGMRLTMHRSGEAECDCRPGFLYSTKDEKCYEAYKQGPCRQTQYFILHQPRNEQRKEMPKCVRNPCKRQGYVCYGGQNCPRVENEEDCLELGSRCENGKGTLVVNQTSLAITCRTPNMDEGFVHGIGIGTRILSQIPELSCAPGTKKDITGTCRKTFRFNRNGK